MPVTARRALWENEYSYDMPRLIDGVRHDWIVRDRWGLNVTGERNKIDGHGKVLTSRTASVWAKHDLNSGMETQTTWQRHVATDFRKSNINVNRGPSQRKHPPLAYCLQLSVTFIEWLWNADKTCVSFCHWRHGEAWVKGLHYGAALTCVIMVTVY